MPRFDIAFSQQRKMAIDITKAGEIVHNSAGRIARANFTVSRLEALYELSFLRLFIAWEICLESVFFRSLCGFESSAGREILKLGGYHRSIADAKKAVLQKNQHYLLWHNPTIVIGRCRKHIRSRDPLNPTYIGLQESVVASSISRLEHFANIRHRIAHGGDDVKKQFNQATLAIAGKTYLAARPGRFLRDWDSSFASPKRWLESISDELVSLAAQMI